MSNSVLIRIDGDDKGFKKVLSNAGNVAKKSITAASASVAVFSTLATKSYKEYEQLVGGVDTLFKSSSKKVQGYASEAYKTAGMSTNNYMSIVTSFSASLKQSFENTAEGIEKAANVADMAIIDMSDNSNKLGTSMQSIQDAYQGFAKQNYTMLDNLKLGYGGTKTEMERLLADAQKLSGVKYDISNLADVYNAIHVIQTELGITGTTAKEAKETIEGSFNMMKASWENLMTGMADEDADFDKLLNNFTESVLIFGDNIIPRVKQSIKGVSSLVKGASKELVPEIVDVIVDTAPDLFEAGGDIVISLVNGMISELPQLEKAGEKIVYNFAEELTEIAPVLTPLVSVLEFVTNDFENLTEILVTGASAVVTYKAALVALNVLQNVSKWHKSATAAVTAYNVAMATSEVALTGDVAATAALLSKLTPLQTLYGVLTGKITLAEASLVKFNLTCLANPYVAVAVAIAALVAGIVAFSLKTDEATKKTKENKKAIEELKKSYEENISSIEETSKKTEVETAKVKSLTDRLIDLDKQLKSETLTQEEATEAKQEFNAIAQEVEKTLPGITDFLYDETGAINVQTDAVKNLANAYISLMKAKAISSAYEQKVTETEKALIDAKETQQSAQSAYDTLDTDVFAKSALSLRAKILGKNSWKDASLQGEALEEANALVSNLEAQKADYLTEYEAALSKVFDAENNYNSLKPQDKGNKSLYKGTSSGTKTTSEETPAEKAYRNLKHEYEMGLKTTREYYNELEKLRDTYYKEGEKEYQEISEEIKELKEKDAQEDKELIDKKFRDLKYKLDTGKIDEKTYYETLDKYRREYFDEGSEEWQNYGREIHQYHEKIKQQIIDNITELEEKHKNLANKLKGYASLFTEKTTTFYNADGEIDLRIESIELTDFKKKTDTLVEFSKAIDELKERTKLPEEFFTEIINLDPEQGLKVINEMLSLPQEELNAYTQAWKEYQNTADKVSADYYKEEFYELKSELVELFGELPEDFFEIGEDSGEKFGNAFMKNIKEMLKHVSDMISSSFGSLSINATVGNDDKPSGITTSNVWNIVNNLVSNGSSISSEINEMNNATIAATQRSGY